MDSSHSILLDTDIGTDIDDALALVYLLCQAKCDMLGVTTVTGESMRRAMLVDAVLRAAGRAEVPVAAGKDQPLLVPLIQKRAEQAEVLSRYEHRDCFEANAAVDFLRSTIREHPGEITLVTVGPATNVGLLFALDPEIPRMLKGLWMMAGRYLDREEVEFNVRSDPHAAAMIWRRTECPTTVFGLNVTRQCQLPVAETRALFAGGPFNIVADMIDSWLTYRPREHIYFHDVLAAACVFQPDLCGYASGRIRAELRASEQQGVAYFDADEAGPQRVAATVDIGRFFDHYRAVIRS